MTLSLSPRLSLIIRWLFLALLLAALVWGPSIVENILAHQPSPWRVALTKVVVFDTELYFQMLGGALEDFTYGKNISWFGWIIQGLGGLFPGASVSELWLVSRWLSLLLFFAIGPWCFRQISQLPKRPSQLLFIGLWLGAFLPLSLRPGIYSWYIPFCCLGMVAVYRVFQHLEERQLLASFGWTVAALLLTMIYPWFFIFTFLWVALLWAQWAVRSCSKWHYYFIILIALACVGSVAIASFSSTQPLLGIFQRLERSGLGYTHLPFIANPIFVAFFWIFFLSVWGRRTHIAKALLEIRFLLVGWVVLSFSWFFSPFTGITFQNDHFRTPVLLLSWITVAAVFSLSFSHPEAIPATTPPSFSLRDKSRLRHLLQGVTLVAAMATIYFWITWLLNHGDHLNALHISLWLATTVGGWLTLSYGTDKIRGYSLRNVLAVLVCLSAIPGLFGWWVIIRQSSTIPSPDHIATVAWIRTHIPPHTDMCSSLKEGNYFSAYAARRIHPMHGMRYTTQTDEDALQRLEQILGAYDAQGAGTLEDFTYYASVDRFIPCEQYPWAMRLLARAGFSEERVNDITGCDQQTLLKHKARLLERAARHTLEPEAFSRVCPVVLFPTSQQPFWTLPNSYIPLFTTKEISIWGNKDATLLSPR